MKSIDERKLEEVTGGSLKAKMPVNGTGGGGDEGDDDHTVGDNQGGNVIPV